MRLAINQAKIAYQKGEIPVGALIVFQDQILAKCHNQTLKLKDPTAHAEMLAITAACNTLGNPILKDCELYVTLEPCVMCSGASYWAMLKRVIYGASDQKHHNRKIGVSLFHPKTEVVSGVLQRECQDVIKRFFFEKRTKK